MSNFIKKIAFWGSLTAIIVAVFVAGVYLGFNQRPSIEKISGVLGKETPKNIQEVNFSSFWKTWDIIESKYVGKDGLDRQKMVWGAIKGLVDSLDDPYSVFFPPTEAEIFESTVRGDFEGVGMEIGIRGGVLTVITPLKDTPAYRAGIKAGDRIIKIDETPTVELSLEEAVKLIRGPKGSKVLLTIQRNGEDELLKIEVTREKIEIPVLDTEIKQGIFIIKLYNFSGNSPLEFRKALRKMIQSGSSKLIIDLRNNAGGYLQAAVDISSWFLPIGEVVAREQFAGGREELYRSRGYNIFKNLPMVILINKGTASAAEITAGA
jgi:carboxyl-terminal processing protease